MTQTAAQRPAIAVTVNGDERRMTPGSTLGDLLRAHDLDPRMVVVERNREILRDREAFDRLPLEPGDVLEIVHFVGGG
jgi:thiamine biosynthesis protein ThiS